MKLVSKIDQRFYPGIGHNWDDYILRRRILSLINQETEMLDLGAGAGIVDAMNFRGAVKRVCGVDLDRRVEQNPFLDEGRVANAGQIPYPDESFDVVFADNVMEHLEDPSQVLTEVRRVLRSGGRLLFKTPNKNHYMPIIARLTPHRFHQFVNRLRGRAEVDTFPTLYRANTPHDVHALANQAGFVVRSIELIESRPEYLRVTVPSYIFGIAYERLVNFFPKLARFRILMIADLEKPTAHAP